MPFCFFSSRENKETESIEEKDNYIGQVWAIFLKFDPVIYIMSS